jgi:ribose 5-phosphate isomerase B
MKHKVIVLGADHAGFDAKEFIKKYLEELGYPVEDAGAFEKIKGDDYPVYSEKLALSVRKAGDRKGILVCGTGIGASIAANKVPGIRAALVDNLKDARLSVEHNDANVLVLGGRPFNRQKVKRIVGVWLKSKFGGGRHARRVREIARLEKKYG